MTAHTAAHAAKGSARTSLVPWGTSPVIAAEAAIQEIQAGDRLAVKKALPAANGPPCPCGANILIARRPQSMKR